jgi:hypothetical protein
VPWPQGEIAFFVADPDAEHERLQAAGLEGLATPTHRPWGERTLRVADPDGNVLELTRAKVRGELAGVGVGDHLVDIDCDAAAVRLIGEARGLDMAWMAAKCLFH